jgi:hypothetical protein
VTSAEVIKILEADRLATRPDERIPSALQAPGQARRRHGASPEEGLPIGTLKSIEKQSKVRLI